MSKFGFKLHCGETDIPGYLRFRTGTYWFMDKKKGNYNHHGLRKMYGVSFRSNWFFGLMSFDAAQYPSVEEPNE